MTEVVAYCFVHVPEDDTPRIVADNAGRLVATLDAELTVPFQLALSVLGYDRIMAVERAPTALADALLANGVPIEEIETRLVFIESTGEDTATPEERVARAAWRGAPARAAHAEAWPPAGRCRRAGWKCGLGWHYACSQRSPASASAFARVSRCSSPWFATSCASNSQRRSISSSMLSDQIVG